MIYGYIRVSTEKQTIENQRFEIENYTASKQLYIEKWIEETVSSMKHLPERKLGTLLKQMKQGDILIVSEISRLGRNMMQIMSILHFCMESNISVYAVKEHYELGNNINSKVLAFAFGLSAEIERNLISQRTKEALARKRAEGVRLGRPKASEGGKLKLSGKERDIRELLSLGRSKIEIGRKFGVNRATVARFIKSNMALQPS